ncbi:transposable element Tcb2 transposase [Trichonephila clavipes]|nr:transposable element Tcb2 transposase [Trichonephila clavipes]
MIPSAPFKRETFRCSSNNTCPNSVDESRKPGTRYLPTNVREYDNYTGGGLRVWAGIIVDGHTPLYVFEKSSVAGVRYRDEVLEPYVRLFMNACGPEFILMDDNARLHGALLVVEFLESENISYMDWPARSPDLNPIVDVRENLGRSIATRTPRLRETYKK